MHLIKAFLVLLVATAASAEPYDLAKITAAKTLDIKNGLQFLETALYFTRDKRPANLPTAPEDVARFFNLNMPLQTAIAAVDNSILSKHGLKTSGWVVEGLVHTKIKVDWVQLAIDIDLAFNPEPVIQADCPIVIATHSLPGGPHMSFIPPFRRFPGSIPLIP